MVSEAARWRDLSRILRIYGSCSEMEQRGVLNSGTGARNERSGGGLKLNGADGSAVLSGSQIVILHLAIECIAGDAQTRRSLLYVATAGAQGFGDSLLFNIRS